MKFYLGADLQLRMGMKHSFTVQFMVESQTELQIHTNQEDDLQTDTFHINLRAI